MRLFLGIDVTIIKDKLLALQNNFSKVITAKLVEPNNFHITLNYLGEKNPYKTIRKLEKIKSAPFSARTNSLGVFPNPNNPKVLYLSVRPKNDFIELNKQTNNLLKHKNIFEYHPHITLARIKEVIDKDSFIKKLNQETAEKIEINSLNLYSSQLTNSGPVYTVLREFSL